MTDDDVQRLINHVGGALHRSLRMANDATLVAGPIDVTAAMAQLVRVNVDIPVRIVSLPRDLTVAAELRRVAARSGLPLVERYGPPADENALLEESAAHSARLIGLTGHELLHGGDDWEMGVKRVRQVEQGLKLAAKGFGADLRSPCLDGGVLALLRQLRSGPAPKEGWWPAVSKRLLASKT